MHGDDAWDMGSKLGVVVVGAERKRNGFCHMK